ncbi:plasmid partitioning protein RepB [Acetobacter sicerae]|uniref:plasmid partitioning protein RepB n=1 Tax=Acetobacter sicerae TaxID=85325 RepID=UPI00156AFC6E|nr:plasmid partitioning protein RepB [Acetobacter sicerae]NHN93520.1 plasmid partitioning protein RepB [Acetobacter sicerae]
MARNHTLGKLLSTQSDTHRPDVIKPSGTFSRSGALGSVARSLGDLKAKANEAEKLEEKLRDGTHVIEIDPSIVDPSFLPDRLAVSDDTFQSLRSAIAERGQLSPILVRPSQSTSGRYQVAFGHRRWRACLELGIPVKAVVKDLSDADLLIAQGQENSQRTDLSFLERALFATKLEAQGYGRDVAMAALGVDKTELSRLISVARALSDEIVAFLGRCSTIGRKRWLEFADALKSPGGQKRCIKFVQETSEHFSDDEKRFKAALSAAVGSKTSPAIGVEEEALLWESPGKDVLVKAEIGIRKGKIDIRSEKSTEFVSFLLEKLPQLYSEFSVPKKNIQ